MPTPYHPPFTLTPRQLTLMAEICERIGRRGGGVPLSPQLRKANRIQSIQASLAMEKRVEFIHPFSDGNGRLGRLWQSLALSQWHADLAYLPVESLIRDHQAEYYEALGAADRLAEATPFVEFMLTIIRRTLEFPTASDQVSDQVKALMKSFGSDAELSSDELLRRLGLRHKPTFRKNYLSPALAAGVIQMTEPDSPRSPAQRYRLIDAARWHSYCAAQS